MLPTNYIHCQICDNPGTKRCSKCHCAWYCSVECQKNDWENHRTNFCSLWQGPGNVVNNPWFIEVSPNEPKTLEVTSDEDLFAAAESGNVENINACIARGAKLTESRGYQGETALHFAVFSGSLEAISALLNGGAYINAVDWRGANALYYACTHPKVPKNKQFDVVKYLVEHGADTMRKSNFSQKRPYEATSVAEIRNFIETHPLHETLMTIREFINTKHPPEHLEKSVRLFVDIYWRSMTAAWMIQPNRNGTMMSCRPNPSCIGKSVESIYKDCQARHETWLRSIIIKKN